MRFRQRAEGIYERRGDKGRGATTTTETRKGNEGWRGENSPYKEVPLFRNKKILF